MSGPLPGGSLDVVHDDTVLKNQLDLTGLDLEAGGAGCFRGVPGRVSPGTHAAEANDAIASDVRLGPGRDCQVDALHVAHASGTLPLPPQVVHLLPP